MNYYCYANMPVRGQAGTILKRTDIQVSINDLVMLRGYGAFDYMRTYYGVPFHIKDYLDRFESSAKGMKLKLPVNRKKMSSIVSSLLHKNEIHKREKSAKNVGIRFLLTGGYSLDSYLPGIKPNLFILIEDLPQYPQWWSEKGIKLMVHEHNREMASVKTVNYITAINLADERRKRKAQDTLYSSHGQILETTRNNFFVFKGNTLITSDSGILFGITRKVVLELAKKKFKVEKRALYTHELKSCTECFITGTTRGITPVVQVDNLKIGRGRVGENTKELMQMFYDLVKRECE